MKVIVIALFNHFRSGEAIKYTIKTYRRDNHDDFRLKRSRLKLCEFALILFGGAFYPQQWRASA